MWATGRTTRGMVAVGLSCPMGLCMTVSGLGMRDMARVLWTYRKGLHTEVPGSRTDLRVAASASRRMGPCTKGRGEPGKREGRGAVKWPNGANYEGRFKDDKIDGQGALRLEKPVPLLEAGGGGVRGWLVPVELKGGGRGVRRRGL